MRENMKNHGDNALCLRMSQKTILAIPGFDKSGREVPVAQCSLDSQPCAEWWEKSERRLLAQLGKGYLPVFRFSDGECYFCLGYRMPPPAPGQVAALHYTRTALSAYVKYQCHTTFWSGQPGYGYESYRGKHWHNLRSSFSEQLRVIAEDGIIAANFCRHAGFEMMDRYIPDIFDWFDREGIRLDQNNYIPFYFIYALLLGPSRHRFLSSRKILVITNLSEGKELRLRRYFEASGASSVNFIGISRSSSMDERIELRAEHDGTDLVLIGAGVGAANILTQVKPLNAVSIDAGYVLECYQNPKYKGTRVFTLSDEDALANPIAESETVASD